MYSQDETKKYYDRESGQYSQKRYARQDTYVQYFFQRRLHIVKSFLYRLISDQKIKILDIGCADGVVTRDIFDTFESHIDHMVGVDISENMIRTATYITAQKYRIQYIHKDLLAENNFDLVLAMGYMSLPILEDEIRYLRQHIKAGGYYVLTMAGNSSLHARIKVKDKPYFSDFDSYQKYESVLHKYFDIVYSKPVGLFIPKLWAFSALARKIQPLFDIVCEKIVPNLYHEKVYILKLKSDNI